MDLYTPGFQVIQFGLAYVFFLINVICKGFVEKIGLNVLSGEYVDMIDEGIVDPAKVTRSAVENAASIAAMVLTTEAMITDKPEPEAAPAMPPGGMDPMGGMGGMGGF